MRHDMCCIAARILSENFWKQTQPERAHARLVRPHNVLNHSHYWDGLGVFAAGHDLCDINS